ncbi:MAG: translation initiation factor IF-2 N-terminal domain-containing protein, partial [Gammaproteobacteria bacterium]|nr:translation initiation factor IF-2 N-terminal domain-containing protein [Gammaproteobacteria bacterium]
MERITVADFAKKMGIPIPELRDQLASVGVTKNQDQDYLSEEAKIKLLDFLKKPRLSTRVEPSLSGTLSSTRASTNKISINKKTTHSQVVTGTKGESHQVKVTTIKKVRQFAIPSPSSAGVAHIQNQIDHLKPPHKEPNAELNTDSKMEELGGPHLTTMASDAPLAKPMGDSG